MATCPIGCGLFGPAGSPGKSEGLSAASAKFAFGSGCAHAGWLGSGMFVMVRIVRDAPQWNFQKSGFCFVAE